MSKKKLYMSKYMLCTIKKPDQLNFHWHGEPCFELPSPIEFILVDPQLVFITDNPWYQKYKEAGVILDEKEMTDSEVTEYMTTLRVAQEAAKAGLQ